MVRYHSPSRSRDAPPALSHRRLACDKDYAGFVGLLAETAERVPVRILAYCIMSNHWHLLLYPRHQGELSAFLQRLTTTHVRRWHLRRRSVGSGHLYQ